MLAYVHLAVALAFVVDVGYCQDPPFPILPDIFIVNVEANILNRNYTVQVKEYFDTSRQASRFESLRNGSRHVSVSDFQSQVQYSTDLDQRTCTARPLTSMSRLATPGANGTFRLESVSDFFQFGKKYHDGYVGTAEVRGIPCYEYTSNYTNTSASGVYTSYSMKWYFAQQDGWGMPIGDVPPGAAVPVRLVLNGVSNATRGPPSFGTNASVPVHTFSHVYEFTNFQAGSLAVIDPELFNPPDGVYCSGLTVTKDLPVLPDAFSLYTSYSAPTRNSTFSSYYAYDRNRQETATFFNFASLANITNFSSYAGPHRIIHNVREGTQYNITESSCDMQPLDSVVSPQFTPDLSLLNGHVTLNDPNTLFKFTADRNFSYQGRRFVDGIQCDLWVAMRSDARFVRSLPANQSSLYAYYFSQPEWQFDTFSGLLTQSHVPVLMKIYSLEPGYENTTATVTIGNYEVGPPRSFMFDDSSCFTSAQQTTVTFTMDTSFDNNRALRRGIFRQLGQTMNLTSDRYHVDTYPGPGNYLTVLVRVHDVPTIGDPSRLALLPSKRSALRKLQDAIKRGTFTVATDSMTVNTQSGSYSASSSSQKTTFSSAEMAGLGIGILIIGLLIGAGAVFVYQRRMKSVDVPYNRETS